MSAQARLCHAFAASLGPEADPRSMADLVWLAWVLRGESGEATGEGAPSTPAGGAGAGATGAGANANANSDQRQQSSQAAGTAPHGADSRVRLFPSTAAAGALQSAVVPATLVRVPAGEALPQRRGIERALKPFKRRWASRRQRELDPVATAEASAERRAVTPVFRATPERWFEVALLVELSDGMQVWEATATELQRLLDRHGAFRRVRLWRYAVRAGSLVLSSASGAATAPRSIIDTQGRCICLFLTNGTSLEWVQAPLLKFVEQLGQRGPTAILQMMPRRAWPHTILGDANDNVRAQRPGAPTAALEVEDPFTNEFRRAADARTVPVLTLEPRRLGDWATFAMATRAILHPAMRLEARAGALASTLADDEPAPQATPAASLAAFRKMASPQAYQLLRLLAGAPLTLPIMRLMQMGMEGERAHVHLAEVVLSGLIERLPAVDGPAAADLAMFEFRPGIRQELLDSLSVRESLQIDASLRPVEERTRRFVESQTGRAVKDFTALLMDPEGAQQLDASVRSFLSVSRRIYEQRHLLAEPGDAPEPVEPAPRPQGFLSEEEIKRTASRAAAAGVPSSHLRTLLIFRTPRQQTWLVASQVSLMFLLDDNDTRSAGQLVQRCSGWLDAMPFTVGKDSSGDTTIGFGPEQQARWYYSESLFPTTAMLLQRLFTLVPGGAQGPAGQLRNLAVRYEDIRHAMRPGRTRTELMVQLTHQMRELLPCDAFDLSLAVASRSDGNRLVAVIALQDSFDVAHLDWLLERAQDDHAFIAFNAARALLHGVDSLQEADCRRLRAGVEHAGVVLKARGLRDQGVREVLEDILGSLDEKNAVSSPPVEHAALAHGSLRIALSSTLVDQTHSRLAVSSLLRRLGHSILEPVVSVTTAVDRLVVDLARCDVYLCILESRYGYVPLDASSNPQQRSTVELEYAEAVRLDKPVLVFMLADQADPRSTAEVEAEALRRFKAELRSTQIVHEFTSLDDLLASLVPALESLRLRLLPSEPTPADAEIDEEATARAALEVAERAAAADPSDVTLQRDLADAYNNLGRRLMAQGHAPAAEQAFQRALALLRHLVAASPDRANWKHDLFISLDDLGDVMRAHGNLAAAERAYREALEVIQALLQSDSANEAWQRDLCLRQSDLGDVLQQQGHLAEAETAYRAALAVAERLAQSDPDNPQRHREISLRLDDVGRVLSARGDMAGAERAFRASLAVVEQLAASDPDEVLWQRDLSVSQNNLGHVRRAQGDFDDAERAFRAALAATELASLSDPGNHLLRRERGTCLDNIGEVLGARGDLAGAMALYEEALAIREQLVREYPDSVECQRDIGVSQQNVGSMLREQDDLRGAERAYRAALAVHQRLVSLDPTNAIWQRDLSSSQRQVGHVLRMAGDLSGANEAYSASLAIAERLTRTDPSNLAWQRDLSLDFDNIGRVRRESGDAYGAEEAYRSALAVVRRLTIADPGNMELQRDLGISLNNFGLALSTQNKLEESEQAHRDALAAIEPVATRDPGDARLQRSLSYTCTLLGEVLARRNARAEALEMARRSLAIDERLSALDPSNGTWQKDVEVSRAAVARLENGSQPDQPLKDEPPPP